MILIEHVGKYMYFLTKKCVSYNLVKIMHAVLPAGPKSMTIVRTPLLKELNWLPVGLSYV